MANMPKPIQELEHKLAGWPEQWLSVALILVGAGLITLALIPDNAILKAGVLAWVVFP